MHDSIVHPPNMIKLYQVAVGQQGYFTSRQAHESGISNDLIKHHVRTGRFIRVYRGVFRFRDFPPSPREHVMAAWLAVSREHGVISHECALELLDLCDIIPNTIDITIPRSRRYLKAPAGITVHVTIRPPRPDEIRYWEGIRITSIPRTIVDVAEWGTSEEHIERAVAEAFDRGTLSEEGLRVTAANRSRRVYQVIERAIDFAQPYLVAV